MHAYTGQLLPAGAAADLTVAVDLIVFRLLSSEAASHAAVNTGHSKSYNHNKLMKYLTNFWYKVLGPKLIFVTGLVKFVTALARLVCPDLLG